MEMTSRRGILNKFCFLIKESMKGKSIEVCIRDDSKLTLK